MSDNGSCPDCGRAYGLRKRCYFCKPGIARGHDFSGRARPNLDGISDRSEPPRPTVADFLRGSIVSAGDPPIPPEPSEEQVVEVRSSIEALRIAKAAAEPPREDRAELIRRAYEDKARRDREAVRAERNGNGAATKPAPAERVRNAGPAEPEVVRAMPAVIPMISPRPVEPPTTAQVREAIAREPLGPPIVVPADPPTFIPADPEIAAIAAAHAALSGLPEPATRRALEYLGYRLLSRFPGTAP